MRIDGIQLVQGSNISNLVVASGTAFPSSPDEGELFFRTDSSVALKGLYSYIGGTWDRIASSDSLTSPVGTSLPVTANAGDLFYLNTNDVAEGLYAYSGSAWVAVAAGGSVSYTITGDVTGTIDGGTDVLTLATVATAGTTGSASNTLTITINAKGLTTSVSSTPIAIAASQTTSGSFVDGRISQSSVTQHQAALALAASQTTSGTFADARISQSSVTQHQAALTVAESQITDGALLARIGSSETITGAWTFNNNITVPTTPLSSTHAASKSYVDNVAAGVNAHAAVRAATTGPITLSGTQTVDGVSLVAADRVLVKDQGTASQNGVYDVSAGAWTRSTDFDGSPSNEVTAGDLIFVTEGTVNANISYVLITAGTIVVGTTALTFSIFSRAADLVAGAGLTRTANTMDVVSASASRIVVNADSIDLATVSNSGIGSFAKFAIDTYGRVTGTTSVLTADITPLLGNITVVPTGSTTIVNVPADYSTISAALAAIRNWIINGTVQIKVADGTYTLSTGINANHPYGGNVQIIGNQTTPASCVITVAAAPTFDAFVVSNGNRLGLLDGFRFNLTSKAESGNNYTAILALNGSTITLGTKILVNNWYYGIAARVGSTIYAPSAQVTFAGDVGIWAYVGSSIDAPNAVANNCSDASAALGFGFQAEYGSALSCSGASATGNKIAGIAALSNSNVRALGATSSTNLGSGFYASAGSSIEAHGSTGSSNSRYGIETIDDGRVYYTSFTAASNTLGNFSPEAYFDNGALGARIASDDGDLRIDSTGAFNTYFNTSGGAQFSVGHTATRDSYFQATGAPGRARLLTISSLTNAAASIESKGAEVVRLRSNSQVAFQAYNVGASNVNYLQADGSATTFPVVLSAQGSDSNIDLQLNPKGSGVVRTTANVTAGSFSGSGSGLTSVPNSALTNSSVTIGSTSVALGATVTAFAGLTSFTSQTFAINNTAATARRIQVLTSGLNRWQFGGNGTAEGGSNAGSDFVIQRYDDAGTIIDTPLVITRSTGVAAWNGSLSANSLAVTGNNTPTNGLNLVATNSLGFFTNSTERVRIDQSGQIGILQTPGTWSASARAIEFPYPAFGMDGSGQTFVGFNLREQTSGNWFYKSTDQGALFRSISGGWAWSSAPSGTGGTAATLTERMRLDPSGNLGIGTSSPSFQFDLQGTGGSPMSLTRFGNFASSTSITLAHSRGATVGSNVILQSGDILGSILFNGANGTGFDIGAIVRGEVDGTPGATADMPGRLLFMTTPDGSATPTERVRIDSAGNVGINSVAPIDYLTLGAPTSGRGIAFANGSADNYANIFAPFSSGGLVMAAGLMGNTTSDAYASSTGLASTARNAIRLDLQGTNGIRFFTDTASTTTRGTAITPTERMRIDSSGNVLIARSSSSGLGVLQLNGGIDASSSASLINYFRTTLATGFASVRLYNDQTSNVRALEIDYSGSTYASSLLTNGITGEAASIATTGSYPLMLGTNNTARLTISSSGEILVGMTATGNGRMAVDGTAASVNTAIWGKNSGGAATAAAVFWNATTTGDSRFIEFYTEGTATLRGNIDFNRAGTAVRYNTSSDARLKKDIVDAPSASALIDAVQIRSFGWKDSDAHTDYGVVAQELVAVVPDAVSQGDAGEVVEKAWAVDYSKLVPMLVKEIQELRARVAALEAK